MRNLYGRLESNGFLPWLDEVDLIPGQFWKSVVAEAVRTSDVFLVCLSRKSINLQGYLLDEIIYALQIAKSLPEDDIFIIPVRLEDCSVPLELSGYHWVNLFEETGYKKLKTALSARRKQISEWRRNGIVKGLMRKSKWIVMFLITVLSLYIIFQANRPNPILSSSTADIEWERETTTPTRRALFAVQARQPDPTVQAMTVCGLASVQVFELLAREQPNLQGVVRIYLDQGDMVQISCDPAQYGDGLRWVLVRTEIDSGWVPVQDIRYAE